jgi:FtsH-binding integral membrane protein
MTQTEPAHMGDQERNEPAGTRRDEYREQILQSIGGWQGALITAIPTVVFVVVNVVSGLRWAVVAALGVAGLLVVYRMARRQSVQQAVSGALGVAVAAFIAARTGQARGYFLLGIWSSFLYAVPLAVSVLVRRPVVGLVWEFLDPSPGDDEPPWYRRAVLRRAYMWSTLLWTVTMLARGGVQLALYHRNATGWLAFARIAMGYPLTIAAFGATFWLVMRARRALRPAD